MARSSMDREGEGRYKREGRRSCGQWDKRRKGDGQKGRNEKAERVRKM